MAAKSQKEDAKFEDKQKALDAALSQIEKQFGKGAVMKLGDDSARMAVEVVPSGSLSLDLALGVGGVPKGRIVEVYGPESSGKTTVALHMVAEVQKRGGIAGYVDAEKYTHRYESAVAAVEGVEEVCMTTNGILLPALAKPLREAGVQRINISLDTLNEKKYADMTRKGELGQALQGLEEALEAGFEKVKINTVLIGGFNDDEIPALAELTRKYPVDVRFIELMPMYNSGEFGPEAFLSNEIVLERLPQLVPAAGDGGVAKLYRFPDGKGNVGLISPISAHFCQKCNRLRLTADGKLKPCLHSDAEYPIKGKTREEMLEQMKRAILEKPECHGALSYGQPSGAKRSMNQIGG